MVTATGKNPGTTPLVLLALLLFRLPFVFAFMKFVELLRFGDRSVC